MTTATEPGDILCSQGFESLLERIGRALVLASGDADRLLTVGLETDGRLFTAEATGTNARAIVGAGRSLYVAGSRRLTRWSYGSAPSMQSGTLPDGFYPRVISFLGAFDAEDVVLDETLRPSVRDAKGAGFRVPADGVARRIADEPPPGELIGLRVHGGRNYALRPATAEFGEVEGASFRPIAFVPGLPTSLVLEGDLAFVGLDASQRANGLAGVFTKKDVAPRAGVVVVDRTTGRTEHWLRWMRVVHSVRSVALVDPVVRPMIASFQGL